MAANRRNF